MRIYIVRHGEAGEAKTDSARALTAAGRDEVKRIAKFAARAGVRVDEVWHSQKVRARETAEILAKEGELGGPLVEREALMPEDDPAAIAAEIEAAEKSVCIVGHLPHVGSLATLLVLGTTAGPSLVRFRTGTMACLKREGRGPWQIDWLINPGQA